jgi:hypothetical protein
MKRLGFLLALLASVGCGRPAQIGADEKCFKTVDALYTAVTAQDPTLLERCAAELAALRDAGKLPADAFKELDRIVGKAREGKWRPAAEQLYRFMKAQRGSAS